MFTKRLELFFLIVIIVATATLGINFYKSYSFKHNKLPKEYLKRIADKEEEVLSNMQKSFGYRVRFEVLVTDKIPGRLYGLTSYKNGHITIYLNKKVVIPHEYSHALLFYLHKNSNEKAGHSNLWKQTCIQLGGKDCRQYVNQKEIILSKMPFKL